MKISKKVREEAALICALQASSDLERCHPELNDNDIAATLGVDGQAILLAWNAWLYVANALGWPYPIESPVLDAEAEALLRTGWSPGDEP